MVACVHVARILPDKKDDFIQRIKNGFEANPQALRALGFQRITSFTTRELGDELLVTVYEVDDPSVIERFYGLAPVVEQEEQAHGVLVAPHGHDLVPGNVAFLDIRTET